eukprot:1155152-Pelagomonas_calceolata.AAC.1
MFPSWLPGQKRLTSSRPDSVSAVPVRKVQTNNPLRSTVGGLRGAGSTQRQPQPLHLRPRSVIQAAILRPLSPSPKITYLPNLPSALESHMHSKHRLGYANSKTGYHSYYQSLIPHADQKISNAFRNMSCISSSMKRTTLQYRLGTLYNQKRAVCFESQILEPGASTNVENCGSSDPNLIHFWSGLVWSRLEGLATTLRGVRFYKRTDPGRFQHVAWIWSDLDQFFGLNSACQSEWIQPESGPDHERLATTLRGLPNTPRKTSIGARVYHPDNDSPNYVQQNGARITNTIVRAVLAAITAAILQGHSHITTDSLSSLLQIRKQMLYPELYLQHVQGHILKIIILLVRNSPTPIYLYK